MFTGNCGIHTLISLFDIATNNGVESNALSRIRGGPPCSSIDRITFFPMKIKPSGIINFLVKKRFVSVRLRLFSLSDFNRHKRWL